MLWTESDLQPFCWCFFGVSFSGLHPIQGFTPVVDCFPATTLLGRRTTLGVIAVGMTARRPQVMDSRGRRHGRISSGISHLPRALSGPVCVLTIPVLCSSLSPQGDTALWPFLSPPPATFCLEPFQSSLCSPWHSLGNSMHVCLPCGARPCCAVNPTSDAKQTDPVCALWLPPSSLLH